MTVQIWARRGLGFFVFALLLGFIISTIVSSRPWSLEFDWAARYGAAYVYLLTPVISAAVAYDVGRRARPEMTLLGATARRGTMAVFAPAMAVFAWSVVGALAAWALQAVITQRAGGLAPRDPWIFVETLSSLGAAAAVGMSLSLVVDGIMAVAASAGAVLILATLTSGRGANLFQVATSSGTMVGIERTPARAVAAISCHLVVIAVAAACVIAVQRARPLTRLRLVAAAAVVAAAVMVAMAWPYAASEYRPSEEARTCVGSPVQVCGPRSASPLLETSADNLNAATAKLQASGLPLPEHYVIARGTAADALTADQTLLDLDSSQLGDGHLSQAALASAISTPKLCRGFYSNTEAPALIEHVQVVSSWVEKELSANSPSGSAPEPVAEAYAALSQCVTN